MRSPAIMTLRLPKVSLKYPATAAEQPLAMDHEPTTHVRSSWAPSSRVTSSATDASERSVSPIGAPRDRERAWEQPRQEADEAMEVEDRD